MAPHSSTLAWKIPQMEEPGRLQSMRSLRVGHDWAISLSLFTFMHWRRKWQPTPVFLPGESQGRGEPGGLQSMGSHRVGHDWSDAAAAAAADSVHLESSVLSELSIAIWIKLLHSHNTLYPDCAECWVSITSRGLISYCDSKNEIIFFRWWWKYNLGKYVWCHLELESMEIHIYSLKPKIK